MKYSNLIYFSYLNTIGGIETWLYNLSVIYRDLDINIVINRGSKPQIERLKKNVRIIEWDGKQRFECKNLFVNFNTSIIPFVDAENIYCVLHGDYEDMLNRNQLRLENLPLNPKIDKYIGITQLVCDSWERVTGIKPILSYNPVIQPIIKKSIRICSAQRMSKEKGKGRIELLASALDYVCEHNHCSYIWDIYTDERKPVNNKNVYFKQPRLDIANLYKGYDWFVALSDNEGYCYSVVENLMNGIPCVVTDLPVFKELGLDESNSVKCDMNMKNALSVANKMFNEIKEFEYKPPQDNWRFLFGDSKSTYYYKEDKTMKHKVEALDTYARLNIKDAVLDKVLPEGFVFEVEDERLETLLGKNKYKVAFVKLCDEVSEVVENKEDNDVEKAEEQIIEKPKRRGRNKNK